MKAFAIQLSRKMAVALAIRALFIIHLLIIGMPAFGLSEEKQPLQPLIAQTTSQSQSTAPQPNLTPASGAHKFFNAANIGLFSGVAAIRTLDYTSTRYFRRRGLDEALLNNRIVDNKPLFVSIEIAGTVASIGISYLFHATGRHKLEKLMSIGHIGIGAFGAIRNYHLAWSRPV
jgi:hypothetical protein